VVGSTNETGRDNGQEPFRVRVPGFIGNEDVGLGDVIKRATSAVGIGPCGGCLRRAEALNERFVFTSRPRYRR